MIGDSDDEVGGLPFDPKRGISPSFQTKEWWQRQVTATMRLVAVGEDEKGNRKEERKYKEEKF